MSEITINMYNSTSDYMTLANEISEVVAKQQHLLVAVL